MADIEIREEPIKCDVVKKFCSQVHHMKDIGLSRVQPFNQIFGSGRITDFYKGIQDFEVYEDDVWITGFPKSGMRWLMEIVWLIKNDVDIEKAKTVSMSERIPFMDFDLVFPLSPDPKNPFSQKASKAERPRIIKAHLAYQMLPKQIEAKKPKIIHIIRNPRDTCISFKNHFQSFENYQGDQETITEMFLNDRGPYYAPYFSNVMGYWERRNDPNVLIIFYEDMKKDLRSAVRKMADFMEVDFKEENMEKLCEHVQLKNMQKNPSVNMDKIVEMMCQIQKNDNPGQVIHKGQTGRWKDIFDEATIERFKEWETKNTKDTGLEFIYES
ncbi:luciferin sulfotransferase-like [Clytia hemisphaerica]|uniref:Sulfotransferase domain-containing protein n=1 Tax=Clytia hemisphaerica TaxID=252671 RepID=A0A7M5WQ47_9CNID